MIKVMTFMRAVSGASARLQARVLADARSVRPDLGGLVVNLVGERPAGVPYRPSSDPSLGTEDGRPIYDVVAQSWAESSPAAVAQGWAAFLAGEVDRLHSYAVTETQIFDRPAPAGGITLIGRLMFHADMPDSAVKRSWALHAKLATKVHVGASRYVQNWVEAPLSPDCPPARGMPEMPLPDARRSDGALLRLAARCGGNPAGHRAFRGERPAFLHDRAHASSPLPARFAWGEGRVRGGSAGRGTTPSWKH